MVKYVLNCPIFDAEQFIVATNNGQRLKILSIVSSYSRSFQDGLSVNNIVLRFSTLKYFAFSNQTTVSIIPEKLRQ